MYLGEKGTETLILLSVSTYLCATMTSFSVPPPSGDEAGCPPPSFFWSIEYGTRVISSLIDAVNHPFLMHNVIESENSAYADSIPGALTAGIMIRKKQIMLTSNTLSCNIIQFAFHGAVTFHCF